jgi:ATPase subunit of ABC transporter with duplicated ATPase domains
MKTYPGQVLMAGHDHEFIESVCGRVIDLTVNGAIDKYMDFEDYLTDEKIKALRVEKYN